MSNVAEPITRARFGVESGPRVTSRYGLVNFFKFALAPFYRTMNIVKDFRSMVIERWG